MTKEERRQVALKNLEKAHLTPRGPTKLTSVVNDLKEVYEEIGGKKYLLELKQRQPQVFAKLIEKLIPTKLEGDLKMSFSELAAELHKDPPDEVA